MSDEPVEFLLPWEDVGVEITLEDADDPDAVMQRLVEATVEKRIADELDG